MPQKHGARQSEGCVNPSFSRIPTRTRFATSALGQAPVAREPTPPHALSSAPFLDSLVECSALKEAAMPTSQSQPVVFTASIVVEPAVESAGELHGHCRPVRPHAFRCVRFLGGLATWFGLRTNSVEGCPRIAQGAPWADSITGGEASQNPCSEKEGFTHPWLWRAPCFWGTYE